MTFPAWDLCGLNIATHFSDLPNVSCNCTIHRSLELHKLMLANSQHCIFLKMAMLVMSSLFSQVLKRYISEEEAFATSSSQSNSTVSYIQLLF